MQLNDCEDITNNKFAARDVVTVNLLLDVASNFSDFFFLFHFQGLKRIPSAWRRDFLWIVGVASPRLLLLGTPLAFLPEIIENINSRGQKQNTISSMLIREIASHGRSQA